jgi:hypothetical protein
MSKPQWLTCRREASPDLAVEKYCFNTCQRRDCYELTDCWQAAHLDEEIILTVVLLLVWGCELIPTPRTTTVASSPFAVSERIEGKKTQEKLGWYSREVVRLLSAGLCRSQPGSQHGKYIRNLVAMLLCCSVALSRTCHCFVHNIICETRFAFFGRCRTRFAFFLLLSLQLGRAASEHRQHDGGTGAFERNRN